MKLKLDENLSRHLKPVLTALRHDVTTAADEGLLSKPDSAVSVDFARALVRGMMSFGEMGMGISLVI